MDRTLKRAKRNSKRRGQRNGGAWRRFSPDGEDLPLLPPRRLAAPGQLGPALLLLARDGGGAARPPSVMLYRHNSVSSTGQALPEGGSALVRRMVVANRAELITAYCVPCAESMGTPQVLCYQRNLAIGEVVGLQRNDHRDIGIAA